MSKIGAYSKAEVAAVMDQAVLKPEMTAADIHANVAICRKYGIGNLCVRPTDVALAVELLQGSPTTVAAVVGFPHGASRSEVKVLEARLALQDGAAELDMVMNIGQFLAGEISYVRQEIAAVVAEAHAQGGLVKVIIETALLTNAQIRQACEVVIAAGAEYVKTSTGFNGIGATREGIAIMLECCKSRALVKASGGIRTWSDATGYLAMGVARLGVSAAATILDGSP